MPSVIFGNFRYRKKKKISKEKGCHHHQQQQLDSPKIKFQAAHTSLKIYFCDFQLVGYQTYKQLKTLIENHSLICEKYHWIVSFAGLPR